MCRTSVRCRLGTNAIFDRSVLISKNDKSNSISWINVMSEIDLDFPKFVRSASASASAIASNINHENRLMCLRWWSNIGKLKSKKKTIEIECEMISYAMPLRMNKHFLRIWSVDRVLANKMNKYYTIFQVVIVFLFNSIDLSSAIYWHKTNQNECQKQKQIYKLTLRRTVAYTIDIVENRNRFIALPRSHSDLRNAKNYEGNSVISVNEEQTKIEKKNNELWFRSNPIVDIISLPFHLTRIYFRRV